MVLTWKKMCSINVTKHNNKIINDLPWNNTELCHKRLTQFFIIKDLYMVERVKKVNNKVKCVKIKRRLNVSK